MEFVLSLDSAGTAEETLVGGKASSLGRLIEAGFNVPTGFVVLTTATSTEGLLAEAEEEVLRTYRSLTESGGRVAVRSS